MILANGCPKSGTHALMAWLEVLGLRRAPGLLKAPTGRAEYRPTPRDPEIPPWSRLRNHGDFVHTHVPADVDLPPCRSVVVVKRYPRNVLVSYVRDPRTPSTTLHDALHHFYAKPFVRVYRRYLRWRGRATVVPYEAIVAPPVGETYTGAPSNWREWWTDEFAAAWARAGGNRLVAEAGYS